MRIPSALLHFLTKTLPGRLGVLVTSTAHHGHSDCLDIRKTGHPIRTIFDVGANKGQSAQRFTQAFPAAQIHSFEPSMDTFALLDQRFAGNPRVHCHNVALGKTPGQAPLYTTRSCVLHSMIKSDITTGSVMVEVTTVDQFAKDQGIPAIDLLKIDAEGFDLEILHGAGHMLDTGKIQFVLTEVGFHSPDDAGPVHVSFEETRKFLAGYGLRFYGLYAQQTNFDGKPAVDFANALFCRNPTGS